MRLKRRLFFAAGLTAIAGSIAVAAAVAGDGSLPAELQDVRAAVARYHSFEQAENDGYSIRVAEPCVRSPLGTMGVHAANRELMEDPAIDPLRPEVLLYLPDASGNLKLVGVEYFKADADQNVATADDRPSLFRRPFQGPMPGHNPTMPIHYDLHAWVAEENPSGLFAQFNPTLSCPD